MDLKKKGYDDEIIGLVDSFVDTDNEEVLQAKEEYKKLYEQHKMETDKNAKEVINAGGLHIIVLKDMNPEG